MPEFARFLWNHYGAMKHPIYRITSVESSLQQLVRLQSQELGEGPAGDEVVEELGGLREMAAGETVGAAFAADALKFFANVLPHEGKSCLAAIIKDAARVVDPLPDLRARN